jgi:glucose-6-phosphate-specific signal transduction histidine kinase
VPTGAHLEAGLREPDPRGIARDCLGTTLVREELTIDDNGVGGADPARGSGLTGLADRVAALGGTIAIASPPDSGTSVRVELPVVGQ